MELLLKIDNYETVACDDNSDLSELKKETIRDNTDIGHVIKSDIVNIGAGADWLVIYLVLDIGLRMIKLGSEINDGIDGWIGLGKKLQKLFHRKKIVSVDIEGANALAIALIAKRRKISQLEKNQESTINLVDLSGIIPHNKGLSKKPHNYHILSYRINGEDVYIIGVTSEGETKIIKHFGFNIDGISEEK